VTDLGAAIAPLDSAGADHFASERDHEGRFAVLPIGRGDEFLRVTAV
jgi:hypothetical protein